jgi:hypothetical protein
MGAQNIIGLGFDVDTLTAQKKQVLEEVIDLFEKLEKYDGTKLNPLGPGGLNDLRKSIKDGATAMGEYQAATGKYIQTVNEQVAQQKQLAVSYSTASASIKENAVLLAGLKEQLKVNSDAQKQLKKDQDASILSLDQYNDKVGDLIKEQFALKQSIADTTKEIVNQSRAEFVTPHSKDDAIAQNKILTKQVSATDVNDVERIAQLNALIDRNNQLIDENSDKLAKQKINIGNYAGSFGSALEILKEQLAAVKDQLGQVDKAGSGVQNFGARTIVQGFGANQHQNQGPTALAGGAGAGFVAPGASPEVQQLTNKAQLLENTIERLSVGFKTSRQESRAFQEAAVQLGLALGQTDDKFVLFNEAVGEVQNGINDIKAATKFQASDAKFIVGLTSAVNGLVGAYGAASAAVTLLGGDEEEAQKSMAKFQQLLVIINGLQQVANVLQEESGAFQLALAAKTALSAAATKINTIITTEAIAAIHAKIVADAELATAEEGVALTTEEAAAAISATVATNTEATASAIGLSLAEDAVAGSAEIATGAVTGFGAAVVASGVGAVVVAVGIAVALLVVKIREWMAATQLNTNQQKELNDALAAQIDALQKINDLQDVASKKSLVALQHQLDLEEKSGQSSYAILALKQKIADKNAEIADSKYTQALAKAEDLYIKQGLTGIVALHRAQGDYFEDLTEKTYNVATVQKELDDVTGLTDRERKQKDISDKDVQRIKDRLALAQSAQTLAQKEYDFYTKGEEDRTKSQNEQENLRIELAKLTADERRKVIEEGIKREADAKKFANAEILNNDNSTLSQRLAAIKSNGDQEVKILKAQAASILSDPANRISQNGPLTEAAKSQLAQLAQQQKQALLSSQDEQTKLKRSYYERDRDAALEIYRSQQDEQSKIDDEVLSKKIGPGSKGTTGDKKLTALTDQYNRQRNILDAQEKNDLDKQGLTDTERNKIHQEYNDKFLDQDRKFLDDFKNLQEEVREATIAAWDLFYERRKNQITKTEADQITALNQASEKKLITDREYARQRQKIEDEAALNIALTELRNAKIKVENAPAGTKERADAEADYTAKRKGLSDQIKKNDDDSDKDRLSKTLNTLGDIQTAYTNTAGAIGDLLDIGYNTQKANLEKLEAQQQKSYEADVARINGSTLSEQEKANELTILDKQRQAQKEINDRKTRQADLEKARFDKAASIANIGLSTAMAIVKFLADPGGFAGVALSVSAGIIGAAQLAAAVATPLPKYRHGTSDHPGGLAVIGDGFEKELIKEPGKQAYWSPAVPTTLDLRPHTQVLPLSRISDMISQGMFVNNSGILVAEPDHTAEKIDKLNNTIIWLGSVVKESARNNRPRVIIKNTIGSDLAHAAFIRKNVLD